MNDRPLLLNYTKKSNDDVGLDPAVMESRPVLSRTISRLKTKPDVFYFCKGAESIQELLEMPQQNLSWEECCFQRAEQLLRLKKDRYYISYSGGIDSTAVLVAMQEVWPKADLEKVVVLLSKTSIEENPTFFNRHVSKYPLETSLQNASRLLRKPNTLLVTGEMGDQLFGSVILMLPCQEEGDQILKADFREAVPGIFKGLQLHMGQLSESTNYERFYQIVEECPFPIQTTFDFFWWFNFTQKWQFVKYRFLQSSDWDLHLRYGEQILHFYDTIAFQQWSLKNHDLKIQDTWESYKFTNKEFIYKYTKDPEQLTLRKIQSLLKTFTLNEKRMAITSDYREVNSIEELRNYVRSH